MGDNIKIDFLETGYKDVERIHLTKKRIQWLAIVNRLIDSFSTKGREFIEYLKEY
jgi:hypothetical protein